MSNAIEVHNLCKSYPGFALKNINFTVPEGLCCGLVGPNGAGKSTTLRIMAGLAFPDSGEVRLLGRPGGDLSAREEIAVLFDQPYFQEDWTPVDVEKSLRPFYPSWDSVRYEDCLVRFGLDPRKKFKNMSRGMKQKLAMAVHLSHHTRVLLLDEPTGGLDPAARNELLDFLVSFGFFLHALMSLFMFPVLFKLGYQKGKVWGFYVPTILIALALTAVMEYDIMIGGTFLLNLLIYASEHVLLVSGGIFGLGAVMLTLSCLLSMRLYSRREF